MSWWQVPRTRAPSGEKWQLRGGTVRFAMWIFCWILANQTGFSPKTSYKTRKKIYSKKIIGESYGFVRKERDIEGT